MKIALTVLLLIYSGCACMNIDTAFGLDGKAQSSCEREHRAKKLCKKNGGLKNYHYAHAECNNGLVFKKEVEE